MYEKLPAVQVPGLAEINANANTIGIALGGAVVVAIAGHAVARAISTKKLKKKAVQNENSEGLEADNAAEQTNTEGEGK